MGNLFLQSLTLLSRGEVRRVWFLLVFSALAAIVQTVAILAIMPFIMLLSSPDLLQSSDILGRVYAALGANSYQQFLTWFGLLAIMVLSLGNLFLAAEHWASSRFLCLLGYRLETLVLDRMLRQPFEYFLANNSARLADIVLNQVERVVDGVIGRFVVVFSNAALVLFIVVMLMVVSFETTVFTLAGLLALYLSVFLLLRRRIVRHGQELTRLSGDVLRAVTDTLEGIREIKTRRVEQHFLSRFSQPSFRMSKLAMRYSILSFLPHFMLETLVFAGLVSIALYFIVSSDSPEFTLSLIALYGISTYRLVPSLKGVFEGISEMQHNTDAVHIVLEHARAQLPAEGQRKLGAPAKEIRLEKATYVLPGSSRALLRDVSLAIPVGSSVCLFGPSGSGKSTLLNLVAGLIAPSRGSLTCDGTPIRAEVLASWRGYLGFCPQRVFLFEDTVASNIAFGVPREQIDIAKVVEAGRVARVDEFVSADSGRGFDMMIGEHGKSISGGQAQRIGIARALYHDPQVLIFDESFNGLDVGTRNVVLDNLFSLPGKTLIFASHERDLAERCDAVIPLESGKIV